MTLPRAIVYLPAIARELRNIERNLGFPADAPINEVRKALGERDK
jgi:hypothetical protein